MRQIVFRTLAGLMAALGTWLLIIQSFPVRQLIGFIFITVLFAAYAVFGEGTANDFFNAVNGGKKRTKSRFDDAP